jgi:phosphatidylserine decarboxylase
MQASHTGDVTLRHAGGVLHPEGRRLVLGLAALCVNLLPAAILGRIRIQRIGVGAAFGVLALLAWFFRHPGAETPVEPGLVVAPAFGRVVHVGSEHEPEMLGDRRNRISIFLSLFDAHLVRAPIAGRIADQRYTPGRFLVALHPKASTLNERSSVLIEGDDGIPVLVRSIAGLVARRIRTYVRPDMQVDAGQEIGFIKLGSRVDVFLPEDAHLLVAAGQKVRAGETVLARIGPART